MNRGVNFRIVVADAGPKFEGKDLMVRTLASHRHQHLALALRSSSLTFSDLVSPSQARLYHAGLHCTYVYLHALSFVMPEVTTLCLTRTRCFLLTRSSNLSPRTLTLTP